MQLEMTHIHVIEFSGKSTSKCFLKKYNRSYFVLQIAISCAGEAHFQPKPTCKACNWPSRAFTLSSFEIYSGDCSKQA